MCVNVCVCVYYKYNITLYNLIIRKYKEFVTCVYIVKKTIDVSSFFFFFFGEITDLVLLI